VWSPSLKQTENDAEKISTIAGSHEAAQIFASMLRSKLPRFKKIELIVKAKEEEIFRVKVDILKNVKVVKQ
jgi:hypothetical protein